MESAPADTPYCRLYIDTHHAREVVQVLLEAKVSEHFGDLDVYAPVFKNHGYSPKRQRAGSYDPIEASRWTSEVDTEDGSTEAFEAFQSGLCGVIKELRKAGLIVTASCDFEDRVAAETGWNWSEANPEPPR